MAALTQARNTISRDLKHLELPMAAAARAYQGGIVAINVSGGAAGYAQAGATSTVLRGVGMAQETADNTAGVAGALRVKVVKGTFRFANSSAGDLITLADIGADCYIVDDQTVAKTHATNTRSVAGKVADVDADGVWVTF